MFPWWLSFLLWAQCRTGMLSILTSAQHSASHFEFFSILVGLTIYFTWLCFLCWKKTFESPAWLAPRLSLNSGFVACFLLSWWQHLHCLRHHSVRHKNMCTYEERNFVHGDRPKFFLRRRKTVLSNATRTFSMSVLNKTNMSPSPPVSSQENTCKSLWSEEKRLKPTRGYSRSHREYDAPLQNPLAPSSYWKSQ